MNESDVRELIAAGEGLRLVFARRVSAAYINERRVIETLACLANAEGGSLLIGVDRDGTVSGCHPFHGDATDPSMLAATVYRHTAPGLSPAVHVVPIDGQEVVVLSVAAQPTPVATSWGVYRTRRVNTHGVAECVGMDPSYLFTRYRDANSVDWALVPAPGAAWQDLDPAAIDAFRRLCADQRFASLDDASLVRALGFLDDSAEPVALGAVALFGTDAAVRRFLPFHQIVVADRRNAPRTWRSSVPLALMLEGLVSNADTFGPAFPLVINALTHRDYHLPGAVYVALDADGARVTSPGGAPRGVDLQAVAAGAPTYAPRSLYLSTAVARTALAEGAGSGLPGSHATFDGSHEQGVVASISWNTPADSVETAQVADPESFPEPVLSTNEAKVMDALRAASGEEFASSGVAKAAGLSTQQAYRALRKLVDAGLVTRTGETRTTRYSVQG